MSFKATAWAWLQKDMTATQRLVLLCLSNHAHEKTGHCWPKQNEIAEETGLSPRTVRDCLGQLEEAGFIVRRARYSTGRMRMNDDIWVCFTEATLFAGRTAADAVREADAALEADAAARARQEAPQRPARRAAQQTVKKQPIKKEESSLRSESSTEVDPRFADLMGDDYGDDDVVVTVVEEIIADEVERAVMAYNDACEDIGWAVALKISGARRKAIGGLLREHGLDGWMEALDKARRSPLCRGEAGRTSWRFNIDFMCKPEKFLKLLEGAYDGNGRGGGRATMSDVLAAGAMLNGGREDEDPRF
jgi:DNA-binding Lrp family transcriptional regulator